MAEQEADSVMPILLRRWWSVAAGLLIGLVLSFVALQLLPATYSGTSTLLIKGVPGSGSSANLSAAQYAVARAKSYPSFINSSVVLDGVRSDLDDGSTERVLREALTATNPDETPLVHITARGSTEQQAQARANSAARHMARFISQIETVGGVSPVIIEIAVQAGLPTQPSSPQPILIVGVGATTGLALGAIAALLIDRMVVSRRSRSVVRPRRTASVTATSQPDS